MRMKIAVGFVHTLIIVKILVLSCALHKVNAGISGQRTIPDTSCIAPKNESTRTHFSIFIIPIRIAIHSRNFKAIRCFVPRPA